MIGQSRTERIKALKRAFDESSPTICMERARAFTESHKETEGQPVIVRRAKAFRAVCETIPVLIHDHELIVGTTGRHRRSGAIFPEMAWRWIADELDSCSNRKQDPYQISLEDKEILRNEIFPYWRGKSLEEAFLGRLPADTAHLLVDTGILDNDMKWRNGVGEVTPDYQDIVFPKGFSGIKREAENHLKTLEPLTPGNLKKIYFYQAVIETCEAMIVLGRRYAAKAAAMAAAESDPARRAELLKISQNCSRVPEDPPQDFWEALQMVWFVQMGCILSENPLALNLGRFDQYTLPYYQAGLKKETITPELAQELTECLWIKLSEWIWTVSRNTANYFAGYNAFQNLTVGGRQRNGQDAVNEISYMALQATANTTTHQPGLSVRIHPDCPEEFLLAVCRLIRLGTGFPAVHNDRVGTAMLLAAGLSPEDARDWNNCGCVVPHCRKNGEWTAAANVNLAAALEYTLNHGKSRLTGERMGLDTGDPASFTCFNEVKEAYFAQLRHLIKHVVTGTVIAQQIHAESVPRPFLSTLVEGCLEKGVDLSEGGAKYTVGSVVTGIGVADVANSLAVIKKLVFEEKTITMDELWRVLDSNWEGHGETRHLALACPKYGNDDDYVDSLAVELTDFFHRDLRRYTDWWGKSFNSAFMGISNYIPTGTVLGATPDGRLAGTPLTEGCSPHAGTDVVSPTAVMKSVAKINHESHCGGTLLNIKFSPQALETEESLHNLAHLIRGFFELGAFHVQFNVVSRDVLEDAQIHPENHRNLLVRVAGYSTRFVTLSREVQDAIIARTTYRSL